MDLGEVASRDSSWRLVIDANLEASRAPVNKLDRLLSLDCSNGSINILGHNVTAVKKAASHVLAPGRVALDHLAKKKKKRH
jgi:hypothetical protein